MITHDREYFYKYVSAETAKAILTTEKVRWSSPRLFNDPFDVQFDLQFPFTEEKYVDAVVKKMRTHFKDGRKQEVVADSTTVAAFNYLLDVMGKGDPAQINEYIDEIVRPSAIEGYQKVQGNLESKNQFVRDSLFGLCIFCMSEKYDDLLMWSHYAASHTGAVIKFRCLPELDTAFCAATPVQYQPDMPAWATLDELIEDLFAEKPLGTIHHFHRLAATKSTAWEYEKEWRMISKFRNPELVYQGYVDYKIFPEEVSGIIFGCRISSDAKAEIQEILAAKFSHATQLQASTDPSQSGLVFSDT